MSDAPDFYKVFWPEPQERARVERTLDPSRSGPYAQKAITSELNALATAPEGQRNHQLNASAFNLAQLVAGGHANHDEVWDLLHNTGLAIGLTSTETNATLHSAFEAGQRQPRIVAEMDRDAPPEVTVLHFDGDLVVEEDPGAQVEALFPRLDWHKLFADEEQDEWIVEPLIPARRLVALFSPPKVGKSLLMLELAVQISRGQSVLGVKPTATRVLYVDFENDPRGDIRTRLRAMGMEPHHLEDLVYLSFPQLPFLDTAMGGLQLLAAAQHYGCTVVIIDTISRAVGGEENDNDTWLGFYKNTGMRLKAAGVACIRLDHTGKDESKGMRGGSAKYGDVDAVWSMTRVTETTYRLDCTANRLPIAEKVLVLHRETEPFLHHRVDPKGEAASWSAQDDEDMRKLDAAFGPDVKPSLNDAQALLKRARNRVASVVKERERRAGRLHTVTVIE